MKLTICKIISKIIYLKLKTTNLKLILLPEKVKISTFKSNNYKIHINLKFKKNQIKFNHSKQKLKKIIKKLKIYNKIIIIKKNFMINK